MLVEPAFFHYTQMQLPENIISYGSSQLASIERWQGIVLSFEQELRIERSVTLFEVPFLRALDDFGSNAVLLLHLRAL